MDQRSKNVTEMFNSILGRNPTPSEISRYRRLGHIVLKGIVETIKYEEDQKSDISKIIRRGISSEKKFGVSLVSTYNLQCGISTYTENLYKELRMIMDCNVISDKSRNRSQVSVEDGVAACWSKDYVDFETKIIEQAINFGNKIIHFQHEFGLFRDNDKFREMIINLKSCGFKVIITMHTVYSDTNVYDIFFVPADLIIVHSESAAARLYGNGVNNLTVISHGTEDPIKVSVEEISSFREKIGCKQDDILSSSVGFITPNKMQKEILLAVKQAAKKIKNLKFLLIGSTARKDYDDTYFSKLKEMEDENIIVTQKFLSSREIAIILEASKFSILNYEQTNFSTSGASHLLFTYRVPSISSTSHILEDLDGTVSIKVDPSNINQISDAIIEMCNKNINPMIYGLNNKYKYTKWKLIAGVHRNVYKNISER